MTVMAVAGGAKAASEVQQGKAQASNYRYQANLLDTQKTLAQRTADQNTSFTQDKALQDAINSGKGNQMVAGSQKAALAANGIGGGSGTALDISLDTFDKGKLDQNMIRYNADAKSWGYQEDAKNQIWDMTNKQNQLQVAAKNAKTAANKQAFGTILSTAASMAGAGLMSGAFAGTSSSFTQGFGQTVAESAL